MAEHKKSSRNTTGCLLTEEGFVKPQRRIYPSNRSSYAKIDGSNETRDIIEVIRLKSIKTRQILINEKLHYSNSCKYSKQACVQSTLISFKKISASTLTYIKVRCIHGLAYSVLCRC
jgi:hypothetical protein